MFNQYYNFSPSRKPRYYSDVKSLEEIRGCGWDSKRFEEDWQHLIHLPTFTAHGKKYRVVKGCHGKSLKEGMLVLAKYNSTNYGVQLYKILGVTDCFKTYGEEDTGKNPTFKSVKAAMLKYGAVSLEDLKDRQHKCLELSGCKDTYGHDSYLVAQDLEDNEFGPWFYISENKWCRGSGAEPLSFVQVEEVILTQEELDKQKEDAIEEGIRMGLELTLTRNFMNVD